MMTDRESRLKALAAAFRSVDMRMRGLPIHNPRLEVEIVETRSWEDSLICILITPWCMNLVLLPRSRDGASRPGTKREIDLPCGRCVFLAGDPTHSEPHWACSLFSPMLNFPDQMAARAVAERIMADLLSPSKAHSASRGTRRMSRRELISGAARH